MLHAPIFLTPTKAWYGSECRHPTSAPSCRFWHSNTRVPQVEIQFTARCILMRKRTNCIRHTFTHHHHFKAYLHIRFAPFTAQFHHRTWDVHSGSIPCAKVCILDTPFDLRVAIETENYSVETAWDQVFLGVSSGGYRVWTIEPGWRCIVWARLWRTVKGWGGRDVGLERMFLPN